MKVTAEAVAEATGQAQASPLHTQHSGKARRAATSSRAVDEDYLIGESTT